MQHHQTLKKTIAQLISLMKVKTPNLSHKNFSRYDLKCKRCWKMSLNVTLFLVSVPLKFCVSFSDFIMHIIYTDTNKWCMLIKGSLKTPWLPGFNKNHSFASLHILHINTLKQYFIIELFEMLTMRNISI